MKRLPFALSLLALTLGATACTQDNPSPSDVGLFLQGDAWRIHSYANAGRDETATYRDYRLSFADSNVVTVAQGSQSSTGVYRSFTRDGETILQLAFDADPELYRLSGDWDLRTRGDKRICLDDDQPDVETDIYDELVLVRE